MNQGRVEQLGTPRELYEQPATRFVAGFIGTSNQLSGTVSRVVDGLAVADIGADQRLLVPLRRAVPVGGTVEVTVRPEKMTLSRARPGEGCALRARVTEVSYLGTSTSYTLATSAGDGVTVYHQNSATADGVDDAPGRGDEVWVGWAPRHSYQLTDDRPPDAVRAQIENEEGQP